MKALFIILLSLIIVLDVKADYSFETFINYLQEKGYFELFEQIKHYYGNDIAIEFCKELIKSADCEQVIRIYISSISRGKDEEIISLESIIFNPDNYDIYKDNSLDIRGVIEKIKKIYNIN